MGLVEELGDACEVAPAGDEDHVDGVAARVVARPRSAQETSALLRACSDLHLAVVARGNGTKLGWGRPPRRLDVLLDTTRMDALVEHARGDLVATAGAGMPLARLQEVLAEAGHQVVVDDVAGGSTLGGAVATNLAGPRRVWVGALRDLVIGVRFVRADGTVAKAGGKVVKNVAGYDLSKLLTGSFGTLAVLTEVTVRLHPVPPASWFVGTTVPQGRLAPVLEAVVSSQLAPHAVEVHAEPGRDAEVVALVSGTAAGAAGRAEAVSALLGGGSRVAATPPAWWAALPGRHAGAPGGGRPAEPALLLRTTARLSGVPELVGAATGSGLTVTGSAGAGVLHAGSSSGQVGPGAVEAVRTTSARLGGSTVVLDAPPAVRAALDTWGPVGGLDLMRRVKDEFDPGRTLAPGRFVGDL